MGAVKLIHRRIGAGNSLQPESLTSFAVRLRLVEKGVLFAQK